MIKKQTLDVCLCNVRTKTYSTTVAKKECCHRCEVVILSLSQPTLRFVQMRLSKHLLVSTHSKDVGVTVRLHEYINKMLK